MTTTATLGYPTIMQKQKLAALVSLIVLSLGSLVYAQKTDSLEVKVSGSNGSANFSAGQGRTALGDTAIRVILTLNNTKVGKIKVTKIEGTFFGDDGKELEKVSAGPVVIPSKSSEIVQLSYMNSERIYEFTLKGTVTYEKDGKATTVPFSADPESLVRNGVVNF